jgi:hypothetical protein
MVGPFLGGWKNYSHFPLWSRGCWEGVIPPNGWLTLGVSHLFIFRSFVKQLPKTGEPTPKPWIPQKNGSQTPQTTDWFGSQLPKKILQKKTKPLAGLGVNPPKLTRVWGSMSQNTLKTLARRIPEVHSQWWGGFLPAAEVHTQRPGGFLPMAKRNLLGRQGYTLSMANGNHLGHWGVHAPQWQRGILLAVDGTHSQWLR